MLSIVEGNTDEVRHSEGGEEKATPSVAKARYQKKRYVLINGHETPLKIYWYNNVSLLVGIFLRIKKNHNNQGLYWKRKTIANGNQR